jgi:hypothetical protein
MARVVRWRAPRRRSATGPYNAWYAKAVPIAMTGVEQAQRGGTRGAASRGQQQRICQPAAGPDCASTGRPERIYRVRIDSLPDLESGLSTASPGQVVKASYPDRNKSLCDGTEPALVVGYHLVADRDQGAVFLLVHGARCV